MKKTTMTHQMEEVRARFEEKLIELLYKWDGDKATTKEFTDLVMEELFQALVDERKWTLEEVIGKDEEVLHIAEEQGSEPEAKNELKREQRRKIILRQIENIPANQVKEYHAGKQRLKLATRQKGEKI